MSDPDGGVRLLVVEDDDALAEVLCDELADSGHTPERVASVAAAGERLRSAEYDVILLDLQLPDGNGIDVLKQLIDERLLTEAVVLTGYAQVATAIQAIKLGAYDYLSKPVASDELAAVVRQAAEKVRLRRENQSLRIRLLRHEPEVAGLVTEAHSMRELLATLERVAPSDLPVLIQGESGTGKELLARAVHEKSPRRAAPFVAINCAAVAESLLESELFGHEKGAFTGAVQRKPGLFEVADRGVVFLDEIGDVSPGVQVKLLRAIETREFLRVGGTRAVRSDVRIVSATNRDLAAGVESGDFREDLYYRLDGVTLRLPPLRERKGDLLPLALHFLEREGSGKKLSPAALDALRAYAWPGNVRELQMVIRRAAILCAGDTIDPGDVPLRPARRRRGDALPTGLTLAEVEERYIRKVLEEHDGHRGRAARSLGIDAKTLYNKLGPQRTRRGRGRGGADGSPRE